MLWMYTIADLTIWLSYLCIGAGLLWARQRHIRPQPVAFTLFASFIVLCGLSHLTKTLTLASGIYRLDLMVVIATAAVSVITAVYTVLGVVEAHTDAQ